MVSVMGTEDVKYAALLDASAAALIAVMIIGASPFLFPGLAVASMNFPIQAAYTVMALLGAQIALTVLASWRARSGELGAYCVGAVMILASSLTFMFTNPDTTAAAVAMMAATTLWLGLRTAIILRQTWTRRNEVSKKRYRVSI